MRANMSLSSRTLFLATLSITLGITGACSTSTAGKPAKALVSTAAQASAQATATPAADSPTPTSAATPSVKLTPAKTPAPKRPTAALRTKTIDAGTTPFDVTIWAEDTLAECQTHAYGAPVIAFLTVHPCQETHRQLLTLPLNGMEVGVSIIQTSFEGSSPDTPYDNAHQFNELVQKDGTGNINDLTREGKVLPRGPMSIPATAAFTVLGQDSGIGIFEFWYTSGPTPKNAPELIALADVLFLNTFN